jgi:hypothetical protein
MTDTPDTHFATAELRWLSGNADAPVPADGLPRVFSYDAGGRRAGRLQQRFVPKDAAAGLEAEWRDVPLVKENT